MKSKVKITKETYIWKNEDEEGVIYYKDGKKHREDGPAVELKNGSSQWFINGNLHREDGPAVELGDGTRQWWIKGKAHREDGPAFEGRNGSKAWSLNGFQLAEEKFNHWIEKKKLNNKLQTTLAPLPTTKRPKI